MKNSECEIVDTEAQLSLTVMTYNRNQVCYLIGFAEFLLMDIHVVLCTEIKDFLFEKKNTDNLNIYYDSEVILLTF